MDQDLILYTNPQSRGRIARWMLEEVGVPYRVELVDYAKIKDPDYLAVNPMGKVPALRHGDQTVTETAAICAYLADIFPDAALGPRPEEKPAYYRWFFFGAGPLEAAMMDAAQGHKPAPDKQGMIGYGSMERTLQVLEGAVSIHPYVAGERFTAVDVYLGSLIGFGFQFGSIPQSPPLSAYWERIGVRPARVRAAQQDDAAVPAA